MQIIIKVPDIIYTLVTGIVCFGCHVWYILSKTKSGRTMQHCRRRHVCFCVFLFVMGRCTTDGVLRSTLNEVLLWCPVFAVPSTKYPVKSRYY